MHSKDAVPSGTCTENDGEEKGMSMARTSNDKSEVESVSRNATRCRLLCSGEFASVGIYMYNSCTHSCRQDDKMLLHNKEPLRLVSEGT